MPGLFWGSGDLLSVLPVPWEAGRWVRAHLQLRPPHPPGGAPSQRSVCGLALRCSPCPLQANSA